MTGTERLKFIWRTLRKVAGEEVPETGRSSVDQTTNAAAANSFFGQYYGPIGLAIIEALPILENLSLIDPDFSHTVSNQIKLANAGHSVTVEAGSSAQAEKAQQVLNEASARIFSGGVDGLINALLRQAAVYGAISSEDCIDFARRRIQQTVLVPVREIRFRAVKGQWQPHQMPRFAVIPDASLLGLVPLNSITYRYLPLQTVENVPFGLPPKIAAIGDLTGPIADMSSNVKWIAKKLSLLGLVLVSVNRLRQKPNETDNEWYGRVQKHLNNVAKSLDGKLSDGLIVHSEDQKFSTNDVATGIRGWSELWNTSLERGISGLDTHPVFVGRPNASTETYADVVFYFEEATAGSMQRVVQERMQITYQLELLLQGVDVKRVLMEFERTHSLNLLREAQAQQAEQTMIFERLANNIIDRDMAARELGYDKAASEPASTGKANNARYKFQFSQFSQRYQFEPERIVAGLSKKKALTEAEINALIDNFIAQYLHTMQPHADDARDLAIQKLRSYLAQSSVDDFSSADDFAETLFEQVKTAYEGIFTSTKAVEAVKQTTKAIYNFYRLQDRTIFGAEDSPIKLRFGGADTRSVKFLGKFDNYYFSKFADNSKPQLQKFFREQYLEKGAAIFGNKSPEEIDAFRKAAGGSLDNIGDVSIERIIQSSVQRVSNYAKLNSLRQAEFEYAEIVEYDDGKCTTGICPMLNGKRFSVKTAAETVDKLVEMEPGDYAMKLYESPEARTYQRNPLDYFKDQVSDDGVIADGIISEGRALPPQHPKCRGRIKGYFGKL